MFTGILGLFVLVCIYIMLGFLFAWVAGVIAQEEVLVRTGVLILVLTAVVDILLRIILPASTPAPGLVLMGANFLTLIVLTNAIAKIDWKNSAIIAVVYTGVLFLISLLLGAMFT